MVDLLGLDVPNQVKPLDGISLVQLIDGKMEKRPKPLGFWSYPTKRERGNDPWLPEKARVGWWRTFTNYRHPKPLTKDFGGRAALIDGRYKFHLPSGELYDLEQDPAESKDIAGQHKDIAMRMNKQLEQWRASVERSLSGQDYQAASK